MLVTGLIVPLMVLARLRLPLKEPVVQQQALAVQQAARQRARATQQQAQATMRARAMRLLAPLVVVVEVLLLLLLLLPPRLGPRVQLRCRLLRAVRAPQQAAQAKAPLVAVAAPRRTVAAVPASRTASVGVVPRARQLRQPFIAAVELLPRCRLLRLPLPLRRPTAAKRVRAP